MLAGSQYFTLFEFYRSRIAELKGFINKPSTPYERRLVEANITNLVRNTLAPARRLIGMPIYVSSGYRCKRLNTLVGGAPNSYHLRGRAADIYASDMEMLYAALKSLPHRELYMSRTRNYIHVAL